MARKRSPQSFQKRKREMEKRRKREEKMARRLDRSAEKRAAAEGYGPEYEPEAEGSETDAPDAEPTRRERDAESEPG